MSFFQLIKSVRGNCCFFDGETRKNDLHDESNRIEYRRHHEFARRHTRSGHVRGARALDLLDVLELLFGEYLVEVSDDLVEESEAFHALVIRFELDVELRKIRD